jgi:hypothetical protein
VQACVPVCQHRLGRGRHFSRVSPRTVPRIFRSSSGAIRFSTGSHSGNTGKFIEAGARVTANEGEKAEIATYTSPAGKPAAPSATYAAKTVVKLGGAKVDVFHFGKGHTGGDSIVYFPDLKVVSGGDVIVGVQPNFDYPNGGSLLEAQKVHGWNSTSTGYSPIIVQGLLSSRHLSGSDPALAVAP